MILRIWKLYCLVYIISIQNFVFKQGLEIKIYGIQFYKN
ncbi:hypothetical protein LEP1GSC176_0402 [Leptospira kirschneri str. MMD1493]|nr:hypothetical protein LEP1GSC176_0402 [Leptospira kirschneri str. MMD1493]